MARLLRLLRNTTCPPTIPCFPGLSTPFPGQERARECSRFSGIEFALRFREVKEFFSICHSIARFLHSIAKAIPVFIPAKHFPGEFFRTHRFFMGLGKTFPQEESGRCCSWR